MPKYRIKKYISHNTNKNTKFSRVIKYYSRKERYMEIDLKCEHMILDAEHESVIFYPSREDSLERLMENDVQFASLEPTPEDVFFQKASIEQLYKAIGKLNSDEQKLIFALFFNNKTETAAGAVLGISQQAVHKRKTKILKKLKNFLENGC